MHVCVCVCVCVCALFLNPAASAYITSTRQEQIKSPVISTCHSHLPAIRPKPATIRAASRTATTSVLSPLECRAALRPGERNENWHHPDYNYPRALYISAQYAPRSARGFLFLDAILLGVRMDSEHICSGNWPSV